MLIKRFIAANYIFRSQNQASHKFQPQISATNFSHKFQIDYWSLLNARTAQVLEASGQRLNHPMVKRRLIARYPPSNGRACADLLDLLATRIIAWVELRTRWGIFRQVV
jgi:hypothetical protein